MSSDISIVIATRNRAAELKLTLESIFSQLRSSVTCEIIVVANGCSDGTENVLTELASIMPIVPVTIESAGKSFALNAGMSIAQGELIAFTDDDVVVSSEWIAELWRGCKLYRNAAGFCGPIRPLYPHCTPSWIKKHPFRVPAFAEFIPGLTRIQPCSHLPFGPNFAVRSAASRGLLFRTDLGSSKDNGNISCEDGDFAARFCEHNGPFWFLPKASVSHRIRAEQLDVAWLTARAFLLGRSLIAQKVPESTCYPPPWHVGWHPLIWSEFDRSLVINFLVGQLNQIEIGSLEGNHIISDINKILPVILMNESNTVLSNLAKAALLSSKYKVITSQLIRSGDELAGN